MDASRPGMKMRAAAQLEKGQSPGLFNGLIQPSGPGEWHASIGYENRLGKGEGAVSFQARSFFMPLHQKC
jgi:hypothetical protein